ncbi:hypothetical protein H0723_004188 [Escherichia coli]|nr:hypothetical protein [Escherichia coli]
MKSAIPWISSIRFAGLRSEYEMAKQFVMTVNRHGGDATLVHLPDIGIKGNSHFLMAEKNNQEIAGILASWLQDKGLDK